MENTMLRMAIGTAATLAFLAVPALATAGPVVPPGNSAATQYTETFPTLGGNAEVNSSIGGGGSSSSHGHRSPSSVLGSHTAGELEAHGQEGHTIATLATEAAPATAADGGNTKGAGGSNVNGSGGQGGKGSPGNGGSGGEGAASRLSGAEPVTGSDGSSGLSEVLGHATGSSSGEMGVFLPLMLLAVPLLALAYAWRRRHPGRAAP
jgi:hypothetical protein